MTAFWLVNEFLGETGKNQLNKRNLTGYDFDKCWTIYFFVWKKLSNSLVPLNRLLYNLKFILSDIDFNRRFGWDCGWDFGRLEFIIEHISKRLFLKVGRNHGLPNH